MDKRNLSFAWIGEHNRQFTDTEIEQLATEYKYVIFPKWHDRWNRLAHDEAVRMMKAINPDVKIFTYWSASIWFEKEVSYIPNEDLFYHWEGERVKGISDNSWFMKMNDPDVRKIVIDQIKKSLDKTLPNGNQLYDGVALDNTCIFNPYADETLENLPGWFKNLKDLLGKYGLRQFAIGTRLFFDELRTLYSDRLILFNGVSKKNWKEDRNMSVLPYTDIALDEDFFTENGKPITTALEIVNRLTFIKNFISKNKILLCKVNIDLERELTADEIEYYSRFSFGVFLLVHEPGLSFYKYAYNNNNTGLSMLYTTHELVSNPSELILDLGNPVSEEEKKDNIHYREFTNGYVVVNLRSTEWSGNIEKIGDLTIPAKDVIYVMK